MKTVWLSFVDREREDGDRFLGVSIVDVTPEEEQQMAETDGEEGTLVGAACQKAWDRGCNPGGEVLGVMLPPTAEIPEEEKYKLLSAERLRELGWA